MSMGSYRGQRQAAQDAADGGGVGGAELRSAARAMQKTSGVPQSHLANQERPVKIFLPNSANLQNITALLRHLDLDEPGRLDFSMHPKWVAVHPVVLAMTACLAASVREAGGTVTGTTEPVASLAYMIRMGLFKHLGIESGKAIVEHEESGRFVPLTQIRNADELRKAITNLVPLLHAPAAVADP